MFRSPKQLGLPRRVSAYHLLFGAAGVVWLIGSVVFVAHKVVAGSTISPRLTAIERASDEVKQVLESKDRDRLQARVVQIASDQSFAYCAVVGEDGLYLAHSEAGRVGEQVDEPKGQPADWGMFKGVRFQAGEGYICEYRLALRNAGTKLGSIRVAVAEPTLATVALTTLRHLPLTLIGPILLLGVGALIVANSVRPIAAIEQQLSAAASAQTIEDLKLENVESKSSVTIGWNRLVDFSQETRDGGLNGRLAEAVHAMRRDKTDDLLNSLCDGVVVTDNAGVVTTANSAAASLLLGAADSDEVRRKPLIDILEIKSAESPLLDPRNDARPVVVEVSKSSDAGETKLRVSRNPMRSTDRSQNNSHIWTIRDVTQQKLAEEMRDQFLDSATHELRTPLANIKAYAETLASADVLDVESQKMFCNTINSEATRLARFIDDLLSISSMEVGSLSLNVQSVDVERLIDEAIEKIAGQIEQKQQSFNAVLPAKYPQLRLDKDKFVVALINLLGNAIKYTPESGHVTLRARSEESEFIIDIEDTGMGISEEELPRIFDKFFRSENAKVQEITGTGLGLSLTQEVIRLHGGDLSVQSELGKGSIFTITLPLKKKR